MNKKLSLPTIASATLCTFLLSNCSTISDYRKDPSEWNKSETVKPKIQKVTKKAEPKAKSGGVLGFFSKYRKDPSEWNKTTEEPPVATALATQPRVSSTPTKRTKTRSAPKPKYVKQPSIRNYDTLPIQKTTVKTVDKATSGVQSNRRVVGGLLTPDAGKMPTQKDLQEMESTPMKKSNSGVNIPVEP